MPANFNPPELRGRAQPEQISRSSPPNIRGIPDRAFNLVERLRYARPPVRFHIFAGQHRCKGRHRYSGRRRRTEFLSNHSRNWLRFAKRLRAIHTDHLWVFPFGGFRSRTPVPPPFSSMNWTPPPFVRPRQFGFVSPNGIRNLLAAFSLG